MCTPISAGSGSAYVAIPHFCSFEPGSGLAQSWALATVLARRHSLLALVLAVSCSLDPWPLYPSPLLSPSFGGGRPPPSNSQGPLSVLAPDENLGPRRRQKMVGVGATDLGVHPQAFDDATCSRSLIDGSPTSSVSLTRVSPLPSFSPSFSPRHRHRMYHQRTLCLSAVSYHFMYSLFQ